jgi:glycosyltransferase involved in cell wall biosynthesis
MVAPTSFFADYGCHVRILEEARVLQKLGHEVTIATYANGHDALGVTIERTLPIPWRQDYEVGSSRHKVLFDALLGVKLGGLLLRRRYDVLHAHLHEGALLAMGLGWMQGLPTVFDFQGSMTEEMIDHKFLARDAGAYGALRRLEQWLNRRAPVIFTNSSNAHRHLVDDFGVNPRHLRALPDCVNGDAFVPASCHPPQSLRALRQALGIPAGNRVIVYLGLLAAYQGTSHLLEAFRVIRERHANVTLLLMGFPGVESYRESARALGVGNDVIMTGRVPYGDAPRYLALGDVAVAPKLSLTEGAGKLLNYMAVGLPTVAFDTPVAREYLGPQGLFAERGSVDSLAQKLDEALLELAHEQGASGAVDGGNRPLQASLRGATLRRRALDHFDWLHAGAKIVEAYAEVRGDRRSSPVGATGRPSGASR